MSSLSAAIPGRRVPTLGEKWTTTRRPATLRHVPGCTLKRAGKSKSLTALAVAMKLSRCWLFVALLLSNASLVRAEDWPTHRHDIGRSGITADAPALPLRLAWQHVAAQRPSPRGRRPMSSCSTGSTSTTRRRRWSVRAWSASAPPPTTRCARSTSARAKCVGSSPPADPCASRRSLPMGALTSARTMAWSIASRQGQAGTCGPSAPRRSRTNAWATTA